MDTLETSIRVLHTGGLRLALVVDESKKLLGTVTDGDIRRALLKHISMDRPVSEVMCMKPKTASISDDRSSILSMMKNKDLLHVPLVNEYGYLVGLETLQHLINKGDHHNPVFLMAGGFGKRLSPLTNDVPKPLLQVGDKPILETIIMQFIESGFHNFYISTHYKAEMVKDYFGNGDRFGVKIEYIHETKPLGTAGALGLLPNYLDLPMIVMNADILTKVSFEDLLQFHNEQENIATMSVCKYDFQVPYGVIEKNGQTVKKIIEKPVHNFFINAGIYVLDPELIKSISSDHYLDMPNLLQREIEKGNKVNLFPIHEYWLDIGRKEQYEQAHRFMESAVIPIKL